MENEIILLTRNLKKYYGQVHAVDGINIRVSRGQVYGFLGPNGSGKTTTIGMILGMLHPTGGSITLFGEALTPANTKQLRRVGSLVGSPSLVPYLSARKNLELLARFNPRLPGDRVDEVLDVVGLDQAADRKAGQFSSGMKQRLGIGMAVLNYPELLILDEPTNGMDPAGMHEIRNLITILSDLGTTIFLSSHLLHEVEQVCDLVAVLKDGHIIAEGAVKSLLGRGRIVRVRVPSTREAARCLKSLPSALDVKPNGTYLTISGASNEEVVTHLTANGIIPTEVLSGGPDLESIFLELTG